MALIYTNIPQEDEVNLNGPHQWLHNKYPSFDYCNKCGLIWLRNKITQICIHAGCRYDKHPIYILWKKRGYKF